MKVTKCPRITFALIDLASLWQLADRFHNEKVQALAKSALNVWISQHGVIKWKQKYLARTIRSSQQTSRGYKKPTGFAQANTYHFKMS